MIHDQGLVDQLGGLAVERFEGEVFRATGVSANLLGQWRPLGTGGAGWR
jgi:hypothetical protein